MFLRKKDKNTIVLKKLITSSVVRKKVGRDAGKFFVDFRQVGAKEDR